MSYLGDLFDKIKLYLFNRQYAKWEPTPKKLFDILAETGTPEQIEATINRVIRRSLVGYLLDSKAEREELKKLHEDAAKLAAFKKE